MLRRSRRTLRIALQPNRLSLGLVREHPGLLVAGLVIDCEPSAKAPWQSVLDALGGAFSECAWHGMDIGVVLSHRLCRYGWATGVNVSGTGEIQAFARHCIEQANGALAGDWSFTLGDARPARPRIACAVPTMLLEGLDVIAQTRRCRVKSVQPLLSLHFNARRKLVKDENYWFVSADADRCCIGRIESGNWRSLNTFRIRSELASELPGMLARERLLAEVVNVPNTVVLAATLAETVTLPPEWALRYLSPTSTLTCPPEIDHRLVAAMEGCL